MGESVRDSFGNLAVAIDLGASSLRYAVGELTPERIEFRVIEQVPNEPRMHNGRLVWDFHSILAFCRRAASFAYAKSETCTIGIDSWGVDHGFLDEQDSLIQPVVCYRDASHVQWFDRLADHRERLFQLTGIQHQPFNTIYQLAARSAEDPTLMSRTAKVLLLPDLLDFFLTGIAEWELTECSTTQLMGIDGSWSKEAFDLIGWPTFPEQPKKPGHIIGRDRTGCQVVSVGSHDTASGVCGLGALASEQAFLNIGTWMLFGCVLESPMVSTEAEAANFTNERAVDGRIRFLSNIPGFYVVNRLHSELKLSATVPDWLSSASPDFLGTVDLFDSALFNPSSMLDCVRERWTMPAENEREYAALALNSLSSAVRKQLSHLESITGNTIYSIRASGGGSGSAAFCQALANQLRLPIIAGPQEATLLGNLSMQFLATGALSGMEELSTIVDQSCTRHTYVPAGAS